MYFVQEAVSISFGGAGGCYCYCWGVGGCYCYCWGSWRVLLLLLLSGEREVVTVTVRKAEGCYCYFWMSGRLLLLLLG